MTFGLQCFNASGELTISSEGFTYCYLGKATFVSRTTYSGSAPSSRIGLMTYQFVSSVPIICAIGLKGNSFQAGAAIIGIGRSGNVWTISVRDLSNSTEGPSGGGTFYAQRLTSDIFVFGLPVTLPPYGLAIYNAAGTLVADLSRRPMTIAARISMGTNVMSVSMPVMVAPAIIGFPSSSHTNSAKIGTGGTPWVNTWYEGVWTWGGGSSTALGRSDILVEYDNDDGGVPVVVDHSPTSAILIETNGLV